MHCLVKVSELEERRCFIANVDFTLWFVKCLLMGSPAGSTPFSREIARYLYLFALNKVEDDLNTDTKYESEWADQ